MNQNTEETQALRAFIIGASGGVGQELVLELLKSPKWSQVTVLVRRKLEEWDSLPAEEKKKLNIILHDNMDDLSDISKWDIKGYSTLFCCLGAQMREVPKEVYLKVNCTYPLDAAKVASHFKVPHFSLVSAQGIHSQHWHSLLKARGVTEDQIQALNFSHFSILKPGAIYGRRQGDRLFEKVAKWVPFVPKITFQELARGLRIDAELQHSVPYQKSTVIYPNALIHELVTNQNYPKDL